MTHQEEQTQETQENQTQTSSFFHQRGWIFLGLTMVVVGSWPGWLPLLMPRESAQYLEKLMPAQKTPVPPSFAVSEERIERMEAALQVLATRTPMESAPSGVIHDLGETSVRALGWMSLRAHLMDGTPFAREAVLLTPLVNDQAQQDLLALDPFAPTGVPTLEGLMASLDLLIDDQKSQVKQEKEDANRPFLERAWQGVLDTFKSLVRVTTDAPQSMSGAPLTATRTLLEKGKLMDAVALWERFEKETKVPLPEKIAAWRESAKARLLVRQILPRISAHMVDISQLERIGAALKKESAIAS